MKKIMIPILMLFSLPTFAASMEGPWSITCDALLVDIMSNSETPGKVIRLAMDANTVTLSFSDQTQTIFNIDHNEKEPSALSFGARIGVAPINTVPLNQTISVDFFDPSKVTNGDEGFLNYVAELSFFALKKCVKKGQTPIGSGE